MQNLCLLAGQKDLTNRASFLALSGQVFICKPNYYNYSKPVTKSQSRNAGIIWYNIANGGALES